VKYIRSNLLALLMLFLFANACKDQSEQVRFSDEMFIDLLFDINIARKAVTTESFFVRDSILEIYMQHIAKRYETDTLSINNNIAMLMKNDPDKMMVFLDSVDKRVDQMLQEQDKKD
jgi:hypothetical protein